MYDKESNYEAGLTSCALTPIHMFLYPEESFKVYASPQRKLWFEVSKPNFIWKQNI